MELSTQEKITVYMDRMGMTVGDLGRLMGWTREWTSKKIHGHSKWKLEELQCVSRYLHTTVADLIGEE